MIAKNKHSFTPRGQCPAYFIHKNMTIQNQAQNSSWYPHHALLRCLTNSSENLGTFRTGPCGWGEAPMPEGWNRIRAPLLFGLAGRGLFEPVAGDWVWFQCNYETNAHCRPLQRLNRIGPWNHSPRPEEEWSSHKKTHFVRIFLNNTKEHNKHIAKQIGEGVKGYFK